MNVKRFIIPLISIWTILIVTTVPSDGGLIDATKVPNAAHEGIKKSLEERVGAGRGDVMTPQSSLFLIKRDPFRAISRGRQLFQRNLRGKRGRGPGLATAGGISMPTAGPCRSASSSWAPCTVRWGCTLMTLTLRLQMPEGG